MTKNLSAMTKNLSVFVLAVVIAISGCASAPPVAKHSPPQVIEQPPVRWRTAPLRPQLQTPPSQQHDGKYYLDDGPPDSVNIAFADIPDAVPRREYINPAHNRPYTALGKRFVPDTAPRRHRARGNASWYGKRYHGRKTSLGERYDMFKMTAAHPTLAIPGYARVTRVDTGASVIVRINDRGPFLGGRIIDLSYAAAGRLGFIKDGTAEVIVETILPEDVNSTAADDKNTAKETANKTPANKSGFYVQLGAFSLLANAEKMREELLALASLATNIRGGDGFHRVVAGPYLDFDIATTVRDDLCAEGWCGLVKQL